MLLFTHCALGTKFLLLEPTQRRKASLFLRHLLPVRWQIRWTQPPPSPFFFFFFFSLSETRGHSQASFLYSLGFRDNLNLCIFQPQRDIYVKSPGHEIYGPMNKCAPLDHRCLLKRQPFLTKVTNMET